MTKREKKLSLLMGVLLLAVLHLLLFNVYKKKIRGIEWEKQSYEAIITDHQISVRGASVNEADLKWLSQNELKPKSLLDAEYELTRFLNSSSKSLGIEAYNVKPLSEEGEHPPLAYYQYVKMRVKAKATERQIYQWLVRIQQPKKYRIIAYLKLSPPSNDSSQINCELIVQQYVRVPQ